MDNDLAFGIWSLHLALRCGLGEGFSRMGFCNIQTDRQKSVIMQEGK
jgi:hypothetical protein